MKRQERFQQAKNETRSDKATIYGKTGPIQLIRSPQDSGTFLPDHQLGQRSPDEKKMSIVRVPQKRGFCFRYLFTHLHINYFLHYLLYSGYLGRICGSQFLPLLTESDIYSYIYHVLYIYISLYIYHFLC